MSYINFGNNAAQAGFQNALSMGLQFGAQAAEAANRRGFNNALASVDLSNPESIKEVTKFRPEVGMQLQQQAQAQQAAAAKSRNEGVEDFLPLVAKAAESPESWAQIYAASAAAGRDMSGIPREYDPEWAQGMITLHQASQSGMDLTEKAKNVMMGLPPEQRSIDNPEFIKRMAREVKTIPFQPGGGVIEYDENTGETRILAAPSGLPGTMEIPPPPAGFTLDGDVSGNAGGGF